MKFISPFLKRVVYPTLSRAGYFRHYSRNGQLCVVTYHGIRPAGYRSIDAELDGALVHDSAFRDQLRLLKSHYNIVSPDDFRCWLQHESNLPPRAILLTCDDGLKNNLTDMVPILRSEGVPCLFFVTGASAGDEPTMLWYEELYLILREARADSLEIAELGLMVLSPEKRARRPVWSMLVKRLSRYARQRRSILMEDIREQCGLPADWRTKYWDDPGRRQRFWLLNSQELRELISDNSIFVGAHTLSHPALPEMAEEVAWKEISAGRTCLESLLNIPIWAFAYPFGDPASVTQREIEMAKDTGFTCAFLNHGGGFGVDLPPLAMPRVHVTADMTLAELEAHVSGFYRALRRGFERKEPASGSQHERIREERG